MSEENKKSNKLIAKNTLLLYFRMLMTMAVSLYASRVILKTLGVTDFGIYNVVGGIIVLFSFVNGALLGSTQRFLNFEIGKGDIEAQKKIFKSSLSIYIIFCIIVIILAETVGIWFLNHKLNIPVGRAGAALGVFQFSLLAFCFNIIRVPYNATVVAYEKMSFYAYLSILEVVLKLLIVYFLLVIHFDKLITYSFLVMGVSIVVLILYVIYCKRNFQICDFKFHYHKADYNQILGFSTWTLFGSIANVSISQGMNIIFNIFYGVTVNASLGLTNQVRNAVNSFLTNFQVAFSPQIVKSYAADEHGRFRNLLLATSKYSFFLMYLIAIPFLINSEFVITKWLDTVPAHLIVFCNLSMLNLLVDSISAPLGIAINATGKIKYYQIIYSALSVAAVPVVYLLTKIGYEPDIVYAVWVVVNFLVYLWKIIYVTKRVDLPVLIYCKEVLLRVGVVLAVSLPIIFLIIHYIHTGGWAYLIITTLISCGITLLTMLIIGINGEEKKTLKNFINIKFKK
ncbi:lipopolysaccharide biosynthesis protein [Pedobacter sp. WC2501]|uniref:lipopolysaccharide biosynthesis protein n=1 Tax=Pedobacter sp. WC2501 TaxID=3461400 RepID=UPI004045DAC2